jgi:3-hydroxyisobutyrate dehydrogenase
MRIGFVGLGNMGRPMAEHLLRAGHALVVHTRTRAKAEPLVAAGARWCDEPGETARDATAVITMVGGPAEVDAVYRGELLDAAAPGTLLIDMTTSSPRLAAALHAEGRVRGLRLLDAPVTGGVGGAKAARLSILVGGDAADLDAARPLLERLGKRVTHCGEAGSGQRLKLANQAIVASTVLGIAEGLMLAARGGLDVASLVPALADGTAGGFLFEAYAGKMLDGDYAATFTVAHFLKDLRLALEEAGALGLDPVGLRAAIAQFERLAQAHGTRLGIQGIAALYSGTARDSR